MSLRKTLILAVAALTVSGPVFAIPIAAGSALTITGFARGQGAVTIDQAAGLDFTLGGAATPGSAGTLSSSSGTGTFASLGSCASNCGTIQDLLNFSTFAGLQNFYVLNSGLSFDLDAPLSLTRTPASLGQMAELVVSGSGTFHGGGFDATSGVFRLTTMGGVVTDFLASTVTQAAAATVPEPASLAILGVSLAGIGLVRRKR